jgi:hypothetical protein
MDWSEENLKRMESNKKKSNDIEVNEIEFEFDEVA